MFKGNDGKTILSLVKYNIFYNESKMSRHFLIQWILVVLGYENFSQNFY